MPNRQIAEVAVTGLGIVSAVGQNKAEVTHALVNGVQAFGVMNRPGRQANGSSFIGAEMQPLQLAERFPAKLLRTASLSAQAALAALSEAWTESDLGAIDPARIGMIVGGSNFQQRELTLIQDAYRDRYEYLRPNYAQMFMDTDLCALCTEQFGIKGIAYTVGGASASGHLAIIQAIHAVQSGQVDACIALGALMDLSYWECKGFRSLGAMGSDKYAHAPSLACRPFDRNHDGFIFGESCGAIVIERLSAIRSRPYASITGWSFKVDAHRNPDPSCEGEIRTINAALQAAGLSGRDIDYINPHGTGSVIGDETELNALKTCGLSGAYINATKSILGHGLSSAGTVELIVTLLQMRDGHLHPTLNLDDPIDTSFNWVRAEAVTHQIRNALNMSLGFGGVNSAICLSNSTV